VTDAAIGGLNKVADAAGEYAQMLERVSNFGVQAYLEIGALATQRVRGMIIGFLGENYDSVLKKPSGILYAMTVTNAVISFDKRGIFIQPAANGDEHRYKAAGAFRYGALYGAPEIKNATVRKKAKKFAQQTGTGHTVPPRPPFMQMTTAQRAEVKAAFEKEFVILANQWLAAQGWG
jgi:hypothetical protein